MYPLSVLISGKASFVVCWKMQSPVGILRGKLVESCVLVEKVKINLYVAFNFLNHNTLTWICESKVYFMSLLLM